MAAKLVRCALYTRKSSDEGLEQAFNSLDAQREACAAYVLSQTGEGWAALPDRYDDGGVSGGTLERAGLQRLMADIACGRVNTVVVYKIDRLTRSLTDFARLVELFEKHDVSFVSVTQAFNTTTSMGRLMLNVLLSFAQFEREVTGERIRDKIAASKARGLWMGGLPPLGYDPPLPGGERVLRVNPIEADTVRFIYDRYLELGSVHALARDLAGAGIVSKLHVSRNDVSRGGVPFNRGALFHLLRNPVYIGRIRHKDKLHDGGHPAIVEPELYAKVQARLDANARRHGALRRRAASHLLTGRLFDSAGQVMSPTFSHGANGRIYRYYVSASMQQGRRADTIAPSGRPDQARQPDGSRIQRIAADAIERAVGDAATRLIGEDMLHAITRIDLHRDRLVLRVPRRLRAGILPRLAADELPDPDGDTLQLTIPMQMALRGCRTTITGNIPAPRLPDATLVKALRAAHRLVTRDRFGHSVPAYPLGQYQRRLVRLAFLAPDIQAAILAGTQPAAMTLEALIRSPIEPCWIDQRSAFAVPG